jgi:MFS family permease
MGLPKNGLITPLILFTVTLLSRLPFTSQLLYNLDSAQFAMALDKYDVALDLPHPPGYFLYVMLAKGLNGFVHDANASYVIISLLFSGLTVVVIYYLGAALFDREVGRWAAVLGLTSPLLWFYGEVALTYIVEAFFSASIALVCWRIRKGEHQLVWWSAILLGVSGGIRQNTPVFLLPLWLFCLKRVPLKKMVPAFIVFGLVSCAWFVPMVVMTGGLERYYGALRTLWVSQNAHASVFESGIAYRVMFLSAVGRFAFYGVGLGLFFVLLHLYSLVRRGVWRCFLGEKKVFFLFWIMPAILFYIFLHIHPGNPGFGLFYAPALLLLVPVSVSYIAGEAKRLLPRLHVRPHPVFLGTLGFLLATQLYIFLFSALPISAAEIRNHDQRLSLILASIRKDFSPADTIIVSRPYFLYSTWHTAYYLRDFAVYGEGYQPPGSDATIKIFLDKPPFEPLMRMTPPTEIKYLVYLIDPSDLAEKEFAEKEGLHRVDLDAETFYYYGEFSTLMRH